MSEDLFAVILISLRTIDSIIISDWISKSSIKTHLRLDFHLQLYESGEYPSDNILFSKWKNLTFRLRLPQSALVASGGAKKRSTIQQRKGACPVRCASGCEMRSFPYRLHRKGQIPPKRAPPGRLNNAWSKSYRKESRCCSKTRERRARRARSTRRTIAKTTRRSCHCCRRRHQPRR